MDRGMAGRINGWNGCMDGQMDDGWMKGWMDAWMGKDTGSN